MDIKKIFNLVISDFVNYVNNPIRHTILLGRYEDKITVIDNGFRLFLIDEKQFPFKLDICGHLIQGDKYIPKLSDYEEARNTDRLIALEKDTAVVIESETGTAWVNVKLLKEYGKDLKFMTAKKNPEKRAVLIFQYDTLLGLVMPIRQRTNNIKKD